MCVGRVRAERECVRREMSVVHERVTLFIEGVKVEKGMCV